MVKLRTVNLMTALYVLVNCLLTGGAQATVRGEVIPIELVGSGDCIRWRLRSRGGAVTSHNPFCAEQRVTPDN